jgi:hypothetical protein
MKIVLFLLAFYQFQIVICLDENDRLNALENLVKELQKQRHDDIKRIDILESTLKEQTGKYLRIKWRYTNNKDHTIRVMLLQTHYRKNKTK